MIPKFYIKIKNGKWSFNRGQIFDAYVSGQPDGEYYVEVHKAEGVPQTSPQRGYYYGVVVHHTLKAMKEQGNDSIIIKVGKRFKELPLTKEVVDDMLKEIWAKEKGVKVKSKSKFSLDEYAELIDSGIKWNARYLSYVIPEPDKDWRKKETN